MGKSRWTLWDGVGEIVPALDSDKAGLKSQVAGFLPRNTWTISKSPCVCFPTCKWQVLVPTTGGTFIY